MTPLEIRALRIRVGLSQRELGTLAGLAPNSAAIQVNRYEAGTVTPSGPTMSALELVLAAKVKERERPE